MTLRAQTFLAAALIAALPSLALAHNGRDVGKLGKITPGRSAAVAQQPGGYMVDIYEGITVTVDPKTGARIYTQVGDVPSNPARARSKVPGSGDASVAYWVDKSMQVGPNVGYEPSAQIASTEGSHVEMYEEPYYADYGYGYGGYYGGYYGGGGRGHGGRPGGGDGPGRPGNGGGGDEPGRIHHQPGSNWSPPPGPYGGGVGSPPPYDDRGVGAPPPAPRYGGFRSRRL